MTIADIAVLASVRALPGSAKRSRFSGRRAPFPALGGKRGRLTEGLTLKFSSLSVCPVQQGIILRDLRVLRSLLGATLLHAYMRSEIRSGRWVVSIDAFKFAAVRIPAFHAMTAPMFLSFRA